MPSQITSQQPGAMLRQQYFIPRNLTIYRVDKDTGIDKVVIARVRCGKQVPRIKEAVLLARYCGERENFFSNL